MNIISIGIRIIYVAGILPNKLRKLMKIATINANIDNVRLVVLVGVFALLYRQNSLMIVPLEISKIVGRTSAALSK